MDIAKRDRAAVTKWAAVNHEQQPGHSQDPQNLFDFRADLEPVSSPTGCALTPQSLYGPYWVEGQPERGDIRDGQRGIYLRLVMQIIDVSSCKPLPSAQVDVWHANATG
jgi:protocatechuate 3,4-dioxygenase beta subunit